MTVPFDALSGKNKHPSASSSLAEVLAKMPAQSVISEIEWRPDEITIRLHRDTLEAFKQAVLRGDRWQAPELSKTDQSSVMLRYKRETRP